MSAQGGFMAPCARVSASGIPITRGRSPVPVSTQADALNWMQRWADHDGLIGFDDEGDMVLEGGDGVWEGDPVACALSGELKSTPGLQDAVAAVLIRVFKLADEEASE